MEFYSLFIIFLFFSYSYLPKNVIQLQGFPIFPLFFCSISTSCFSFCTPKNDLFSFLTNGVFNFIHDPLFSSRILFHILYNYHNFVSAKCSFLTIYAHIHFTYLHTLCFSGAGLHRFYNTAAKSFFFQYPYRLNGGTRRRAYHIF